MWTLWAGTMPHVQMRGHTCRLHPGKVRKDGLVEAPEEMTAGTPPSSAANGNLSPQQWTPSEICVAMGCLSPGRGREIVELGSKPQGPVFPASQWPHTHQRRNRM